MKNKPFLIASIIFGCLGLLVLILTVISFFEGDNLISGAIASMLNLGKDSFTDATMAQIAVVFFIPTFIFAFRSLSDTDEETAKSVSAASTAALNTPSTTVRSTIQTAEADNNPEQAELVITDAEVTESAGE